MLNQEKPDISTLKPNEILAEIHSLLEGLEVEWHTQTDASGKPDTRVCPYCRPLHMTVYRLGDEIPKSGNDAGSIHEVNGVKRKCRCFYEVR